MDSDSYGTDSRADASGTDSYRADFDDTAQVLTVSGEVDEPAAMSLRHDIETHSGQFSQDLVIDLTGVGYLPSAAVGVLATVRQRFSAQGSTIELVAGEGSIAQRILTVCALPHRTS